MLLFYLINPLHGIESIRYGSITVQQMERIDTLVGLVVNTKGKAIRNVAISTNVKDSVVHTNKKGIFTLENISLNDTLVLTLPKNKIYTIPVSGISFMKITVLDHDFMTEEAKEMIVDIGYGTMLKSKATGSGDLVFSGEDLIKTGERNLFWALAGIASGVKVVHSDMGESYLTIRGAGTASFLSQDQTPLYVMDGVMINRIDDVSLHDIQQVTILKNASVYGARGANGAIIITTKK